MSWDFTGIEFQVLCERYRDGELPAPLFYTLDEPMTLDESARLKGKTWDELRAKWDPAWDSMIEAMCAPEMYIRVHGWDELDMENGKKKIYMHFARKGVWAYKFNQKPGKTFWHTDGYTVTECDPRSLGAEVVRSLPKVGAGHISSVPVVTDPQEYIGHGGGSFIMDDDHLEDRAVAGSRKFFETKASLTGTIVAVQGRSKYGPRGIHETKKLFRDVIGDGRYVMALDDAPVAEAVGPQQLADRIQDDIDNLMLRMETHWESGYPQDRY
ncbi:ESX secretion-associated protein EspG [Nocardia sp. BMG51109]|uniref:ESX secretion-associated protein EspG n=1 Tax=Nocardia sp. BMG51109 TaxID=1056816 RepID=UPI0004667796|nr:ESX secretion-associated protein EspG [Nocardia sp. BMG51109]